MKITIEIPKEKLEGFIAILAIDNPEINQYKKQILSTKSVDITKQVSESADVKNLDLALGLIAIGIIADKEESKINSSKDDNQ